MTLFVSKLSPEQWAEACRLYGEGASAAAIARQFGVTSQTIRTRALKERWPSPSPSGAPARHAQAPDAPAPEKRSALAARLAAQSNARLQHSTAQARRSLTRRMFRILDMEFTLVEKRMQRRLDVADKNPDAPITPSEPDLKHAQSVMQAAAEVTELEADTERRSGAQSRDQSADRSPGQSTGQPSEQLGGKHNSAAARAAASEADVFRREIAERIEKLIPPS